ncbi:hypothetical protein D3C73_1497250 [compost metagenome]
MILPFGMDIHFLHEGNDFAAQVADGAAPIGDVLILADNLGHTVEFHELMLQHTMLFPQPINSSAQHINRTHHLFLM